MYMFDATNGVAFGDPNGGNYECCAPPTAAAIRAVPNANIPQPTTNEAGPVLLLFLARHAWRQQRRPSSGPAPAPSAAPARCASSARWTWART
ncbi:MAG: hypothetical protein WKG07_45730 [Hymenobacter sp.]